MLSDRPVIKLIKTGVDKMLEGVAFAGIICMWVYILSSYSSLPEIIPIHYDLKGGIDGYGSKATLFILPVIVTFLVAGLFFLNKYPHIFNYTGTITTENAKRQYTIATRMLRVIQLMIVLIFMLLCIDTVLSAKSGRSYFSAWMVPLFIVAMIMPTVIAWRISKKQG